jgi:hypothetical protein
MSLSNVKLSPYSTYAYIAWSLGTGYYTFKDIMSFVMDLMNYIKQFKKKQL